MTFDIAACRVQLRARQAYRYQTREQQRLAVLQGLRDAAQAVFSRFPHIQRAYLFGSVLRPGALQVTSDIDIAVEGRLTAEDYFALWRAWECVVGYRPIDLLELDRDIHFADRVRDQGLLIYEHADSDAES
jgi:predicted nucleotidyltransferase